MSVAAFAEDYVAGFNHAVASGDFSGLIARFTDDVVMRFENVPPAGRSLEFAGREACAAAYAQNPPDDQIEVTGEPAAEGGLVVIPFAWRREGSPGTMRLAMTGDRVSAVTVTFG